MVRTYQTWVMQPTKYGCPTTLVVASPDRDKALLAARARAMDSRAFVYILRWKYGYPVPAVIWDSVSGCTRVDKRAAIRRLFREVL